MRIIESSASIVPQEPGLIGAYKQIEKVGRACWASENLITEDSYDAFVKGLISRGHTAPLEHGTVYLVIMIGSPIYDPEYMFRSNIAIKFGNNPYSRVVRKSYDVAANAPADVAKYIEQHGPTQVFWITTNMRVIVESFDLDVLDFMVNKPHEEHVKRVTVHFTCQRAISAEFNRHRKDSIMERSSRYCNFSIDKFGNEIGIVPADWLGETYSYPYEFIELVEDLYKHGSSDWRKIDYWMFANLACEWSYMKLIEAGCKAEEARDILPMDLQTELYHTAFIDDWEHFFKLRAWNSKGNRPHPEAKKLAKQVYDRFVERGLVSQELRIQNEIIECG